jgi:GDPmannose 4,6-dehydratase
MRKALICGISGQDGAYLAKLLLEKGYVVYGGSRDAQMSSFSNLNRLGIRKAVEVVSISISDFRSVLQTLLKVKPDEVYNLAGQSSVGLSFEQPVETLESISVGTLNLLEAIRFSNLPIKFYNAGSRESPLRPERFVTQKIVSVACRIAAGSNEMLTLGNIDIARDWGWAPDYVEAMWLMLQQEQADDYVIATGHTHKLRDFIDVVFNTVGLDWEKYVRTDSSFFRPTDIMAGHALPAKAKIKLGWEANHKMHDIARMMVEERT